MLGNGLKVRSDCASIPPNAALPKSKIACPRLLKVVKIAGLLTVGALSIVVPLGTVVSSVVLLFIFPSGGPGLGSVLVLFMLASVGLGLVTLSFVHDKIRQIQ